MTRRNSKGAPPATTALSVPGIRVVVADPAPAPEAAPAKRTVARTPASGASPQHRKRRAKFVF
jgi:hypothetical protein